MQVEPVEALRAGRQLISDPRKWTTRHYARDPNGAGIAPQHPAACQWCGFGAIERVAGDCQPAENALDRAAGELYGGHTPFTFVNDHYGHGAAMRCYDAAISREERKC